jgi:hypothetical protein
MSGVTGYILAVEDGGCRTSTFGEDAAESCGNVQLGLVSSALVSES